ncbi:MAG: hypothetical protein JSW26_04975 [Desulfobacterales bacterium]|nr:MAG: hypothetical protein JSW26_04975 [Desulfobacterales bacterium]
MASGRKKTPDFFDENGLDPVETATGYRQPLMQDQAAPSDAAANAGSPAAMTAKKKAGFYLSVDILNRFTHKFHELKLAGIPIDNKSTLLEAALGYALDDMDKGEKSQVLKKLGN